jgi:hypothetical protein
MCLFRRACVDGPSWRVECEQRSVPVGDRQAPAPVTRAIVEQTDPAAAADGRRYVSPLLIIAQAVRAILLASATAAKMPATPGFCPGYVETSRRRDVSANTSRSRQPPIGGGTAAARGKIAREGEQQTGSCLITAAGARPGSVEAASTGETVGNSRRGCAAQAEGMEQPPAYHTTRAGRLEQPVKRYLRLPQGGSIDLDQTIDRHIRRAPKSIWRHRSSRFSYA